jgi:uncharacterized SAM-binding protein YcdF (DUF218 family)
MFFTLSKVLWFLVSPDTLLLLALLLAALLSFTKKAAWSRFLLRLIAIAALLVATVPIGSYGVFRLENRFPANPALPAKVDGILVLGGVISAPLSAERQSPQLGGAVERITEAARLAQQYPYAKVIFSGGSGDPFNPEQREAHYAPPLFRQLGLPDGRVTYDDSARNTAENAAIMRDIAKPGSDENWVLVTSAFHMPRAVGTFRQAGWRVIPFPVDFSTGRTFQWQPTFSLRGGLSNLDGALHEFIGLWVYHLTGRSDSWFPGPAS